MLKVNESATTITGTTNKYNQTTTRGYTIASLLAVAIHLFARDTITL
jgi:hypothetical protein